MRTPRPRRRWGSLAAALSGALLIAASLAAGLANETNHRSRQAQALAAQANVLAATAAPALVFDDAEAARDIVAALAADPNVEAAGVYDAAGARVARFARGGAEPPSHVAAVPRQVGGRRMSVLAPVELEGERIGAVYLRSAPEPLAVLAARHAGTLVLLLVAAAVVGASQGVQSALRAAAAETEARARDLAEANRELQAQIRARESAEEALRQAQKMETLGRLTGGIAHDFNNLLQSVQGSLDLIQRKPNDPAKIERWASTGMKAAERGARLTAQLLAFSRQQKLELRPIDVTAVVERLAEFLPTTLGPQVRVEFALPAQATSAIGDPVQLELAILNLCINARDAMADGGLVVVRARETRIEGDPELADGSYVLLSVSDEGPGMPEEVRARAFEPFFTTKGVGKGTGLGLAQVYGIAKQAGGTARIESSPGDGATVTLYLPSAEAAPAAEPPADDIPSPTRPGARILVIDDDPGVRRYVLEALTNLGYEAREAPDGPSGLEAFHAAPTDLLVLDYAMPGMTGADVARQVRAERPDMPILFVSGYAESEALEASVGTRARLLRKPFETAALARCVDEALSA